VPEEIGYFFSDPYLASVVKGIAERLETTDYIVNLLVSSSDPRHKTRRFLSGGNVDGALMVSHHASNLDLIRLLARNEPAERGRVLATRLVRRETA
jgi:DNA-binding LacI/PurR family transcriptional regulator